MEPPDVIVYDSQVSKTRKIKNLVALMEWAYRTNNKYIHGRCMLEIIFLNS